MIRNIHILHTIHIIYIFILYLKRCNIQVQDGDLIPIQENDLHNIQIATKQYIYGIYIYSYIYWRCIQSARGRLPTRNWFILKMIDKLTPKLGFN